MRRMEGQENGGVIEGQGHVEIVLADEEEEAEEVQVPELDLGDFFNCWA